ncbi:uncharacterized protein LOC144881370 [Branchiostoma floridae x Branchiostoma japonicum]
MSSSNSYISSLEPNDRTRYFEKLMVSVEDAGDSSNPEVTGSAVTGDGVRLPDPYSLTGWKDDLSLWPDTDYGCIYTYLIEAPGPFNGEAMKAYKSLEAYNLFISGHVRECRYHPIGKNVKVCFLKAKVVPGQRVTETPHNPWVCLTKKEGYVMAAHCTCMAGLGEVCSHVAALLFAVEASRSLQEKRTSCTSRKAVWNKYYKDKVDPQRAEDMDFSHPKHGVQIKKARRKPQCDVPPLSEEEAASAFSQLRKLCPTASAVIKEEEDTDTASEDESDVNTETLPPVVYRSCHPAKVPVTSVSVDSILEDVRCNPEQITNLNKATVGQSKSALWRQQRKGRVTSTSMHDVLHASNPTTAVRKVMQYDCKDLSQVPAIQWGMKQEEKARQQYLEATLCICKDVKLEEVGLILYKDFPFIGASPDGMRQCSCHGRTVIEIKCPYKYRDIYPAADLCLSDANYCLDKDCKLKTGHRYYTQVQTHMLVTGVSTCDFVVWTNAGMVVVNVSRDQSLLNVMLSTCVQFVNSSLIPEILTHKLQCGDSGVDVTFQEDDDPNKRYCSCQKPAYGRMVKCDNNECESEWFHYKCVGIKRKPRGHWFCPSCQC